MYCSAKHLYLYLSCGGSVVVVAVLGVVVYLSIYLPTYLPIYLSIYLSFFLCIYPCIYLSFYLSIHPSIRLSASLKTKLFCETSSIFELDNIRSAAILRDFINFELDNVKTKELCETSSTFQVDNIKNETILRDLLQKWKIESKDDGDGLVPMRFAVFPFHLFKALRLPRKSEARS